jgi:hypothetical protein
MNAEQITKWSAIREKGQRSYLLKRTLLWGTILSFVEIGQSELDHRLYSKLEHRLYMEQMVDITMQAIFGKDYNSSPESPIVYNFTSYSGEVIECFLLAWFVALAVWTYKEQYYCAYRMTKASDY